jgi:hypothetical protein
VTISVVIVQAPQSFATALPTGWNFLSTPVTLDPAFDRLDQVFDATNIANLEIAYAWSNGQWLQISGAYRLKPLEAIVVKVKAATTATATFKQSTALTPPPNRALSAGLNLVGIAPSLENGAFPQQALAQALIHCGPSAGGNGYLTVISPALNQAGWSYVAGGTAQVMLPFKGYWVIMDNADTIYGFSTTPLQ